MKRRLRLPLDSGFPAPSRPSRFRLLRVIVTGFTAAILSCWTNSVAAQATQPSIGAASAASFAPDRVIVRYKTTAQTPPVAGVPSSAAVQSAPAEAVRQVVRQSAQSTLIRKFTGDNRLELLRLPSGVAVADAVTQLRSRPEVEYAEPDFKVSIVATPSDPAYADGTQWGMNNTGQTGPDGAGVAGADIRAPGGWDVRTDASSVVVAVIDTGIRRTHEDLAANMWVNPGETPGNGTDDDGNGYVDDYNGLNAITYTGGSSPAGDPNDDNGHGTHCAGIIGGRGNNGIGVAGVAWKVKLMACKFLDASGSGYDSDAVECIDYARLNGAKVISASWGGAGYSQALFDAIKRARDAGIIFVAAANNYAGNNDISPNYPSNFALSNVVAVASSNRFDSLSSFSNFGAATVHLAAPGEQIYSSYNSDDHSYTYLSGTSMATPHVAGALALLAAQYPGDAPNRLVNRLLNSTRPLPALAGRTVTGGMLNLEGALTTTNIAPFNNDRVQAQLIRRVSGQAANFFISGNNDAATKEAGEPSHGGNNGGASVWYKIPALVSGAATFTAIGNGSFRPVLAIYRVEAGGALANMGGVANGTTTGSVDCLLQAGRTYFIAVDGFDGATGVFDLVGRQPPVNDDFLSATVLVGSRGTLTQDANGISLEPTETFPGGFPYGSGEGGSIWYKWTAPTTGSYTFLEVASPGDSGSMAVYTGTSLASLSLVPFSKFGLSHSYMSPLYGIGFSVQEIYNVTAGTTYYIQAYTNLPGVGLGTFRLDWDSTPANDEFDNRAPLSGTSGSVVGDSRGATGSVSTVSTYGFGTKDVWFKWVSPYSGWVDFDTLSGTSWDTTLEVYTGGTESLLQLVGTNDDAGGGYQSLVSFFAVAGTEYAIRLNGYTFSFITELDTPAGPYQLRWLLHGTSPSDFNGDGKSDIVWENTVSGDRYLWFMNGSAITGAMDLGVISTDWRIGGAGDFNGDGKSDIVWENTVSGDRYLWFMNGAAITSAVDLGVISTDWRISGAGDFNGDGKADMLWENTVTGDRYIWFMNGSTITSAVDLGVISTTWRIGGLGDLDGDGKADLLWENTVTGDRYIWFMNGSTITSAADLGIISTDWRMDGTGDFDGDGKADILWENTVTGDRYIWFMNGSTITSAVDLGIIPTDWRSGN